MIAMIAAAILAFLFMQVLMPGCIRKLKALKFGQTMYELGPQSHLNKKGTPNMGGIVMGPVTVLCTVICFVIWRQAGGAESLFHIPFWSVQNALWALLFLICACMMAVGFADDYIKDIKKDHEGLRPGQKIIRQIVIGFAFSLWAYFCVGSDVVIPFTGKTWDLGIFYVPLLTLTVIFMTNSANLQDGLDGLLSSVTAVGMAAFGLIAFLLRRDDNTLLCGILSFAMTGAALGFLRFNHYPARIFMGDTGSMFIGAVMTGVAVVLKMEFLLLLICFTCVFSSVSVIMQRVYFKLTHGKRIFKMSPIHHHFEMCGMKETRIVCMYALVTAFLSIIAVVSVGNWIGLF
ncbi:MAG: phospho-N-acetylmuramoyl-pentapeptide-transferase [Clostridia bacterium]|nr:phospho-N-acetylmuramoyl-pentapeptide-transferase [Clostridia bacterium]